MAKQNVTYEIRAYDKASGTFKKVELQSDKTKRSVDNLNKGSKNGADDAGSAWSKTNSVLRGTALIAAGVVAVRMGYNLSKDAVMAAAQLEKYNVTLKTMLGSTSAARDRMEEYLDVAKKTPFELSQVVEAGNQLQAIGRYSRQNLEMLGDLAAASGKPMEQVMNAYAKLATGQKGEAVNMFRDLLISTDDWTKATGRAKAKNGELLASTEQMIKALPKIMKEKGFFGMMASQAETTEGKLSNAKDAVFTLSDALGERLKPTTDDAISAFTKWVGITEDWIRIPTAEKIATEKVELNLLVGQLTDANIKGEARKNIIDEIQRKYPEFLKNIDLEKVTTNQLTKALKETNAEYDKKIRLATLSAYKERTAKDRADALATVGEKTVALAAKPMMEDFAKKTSKAIGEKYVPSAKDATEPGNRAFETWYGKAEKLSKTNPNVAADFYQFKAYRETYKDNKSLWGTLEQQKKDAEEKLATYIAQDKIVEGLIEKEGGATNDSKSSEGKGKEEKGNSPTDTVFGNTSSSNSGGGASYGGSGRGSGSGEAKNVTTHIQNLINGDIVIQTTNLTEGAAEIKRIVIQTLLDATNEIN